MTASSVTSPNASVSAPSSSVPSASSVSSPSSSSSSAVSNVSPPVSSVKPVGSSTVKPFGNYDSSGTCVESSSTECKTSKDLSDEADRLEEQARKAAGDAERERARLEAARIRAQLDIREAVGNDRTADSYVSRIEKSALYNSLKDNPVGKTMFWLGISSKLDGRGWNEVFSSPRGFVEGVVRASETLVFKGRDSNGRMILAPVTPSGNDPIPIPPSSVVIGGLLPPVPNTVVRGSPLAIGAAILLGGIAISPDMSGALIEGIFNGGGQVLEDLILEAKKVTKKSGKEAASDVPSWARGIKSDGSPPTQQAEEVMEAQYGPDWRNRPNAGRELSQIQKRLSRTSPK